MISHKQNPQKDDVHGSYESIFDIAEGLNIKDGNSGEVNATMEGSKLLAKKSKRKDSGVFDKHRFEEDDEEEDKSEEEPLPSQSDSEKSEDVFMEEREAPKQRYDAGPPSIQVSAPTLGGPLGRPSNTGSQYSARATELPQQE